MIKTWLPVLFCLGQSALFSGLTIGLFSLSRLRLEIMADTGDRNALKILGLRQDANFLLATLLWGNVAVNVLFTLLMESVLTRAGAFVISTAGITIVGDILPQAYFARHALRHGAALTPLVRVYQFVLFPLAKPTAFLLDAWLGKEGITFFQEQEVRAMLERQSQSATTDVGRAEALGASNFLALDDALIEKEGEPVDPRSVIVLPMRSDRPVFPPFAPVLEDPFLQKIRASKKKWVIIADTAHFPRFALDADSFLREFLWGKEADPFQFCHRPLVVTTPGTKFGHIMGKLGVEEKSSTGSVVDHDLILFWNEEKRIITGGDILGRLLHGIGKNGPS